jgi:hypothetical protein
MRLKLAYLLMREIINKMPGKNSNNWQIVIWEMNGRVWGAGCWLQELTTSGSSEQKLQLQRFAMSDTLVCSRKPAQVTKDKNKNYGNTVTYVLCLVKSKCTIQRHRHRLSLDCLPASFMQFYTILYIPIHSNDFRNSISKRHQLYSQH